MTDAQSSRLFQDLTASEIEQLELLRRHPGWPIYQHRLRIAQAQMLQRYLDTKDDLDLREFTAFKRAEKLLDWMLYEVKQSRALKKKLPLPDPPDESISMEDLALLEAEEKHDVS